MSTIPDEIRALGFPDIQNVVVLGGAFLELQGLRKANDIDLAVSEDNWVYLRDHHQWPIHTRGISEYMRDTRERFDVWPGWYDQAHRRVISFSELIDNSVVHPEGFRVPTVEYQIQLKTWDDRDKDRSDIQLLKSLQK